MIIHVALVKSFCWRKLFQFGASVVCQTWILKYLLQKIHYKLSVLGSVPWEQKIQPVLPVHSKVFLIKAYNFIIFHNKVQDWSCSISTFFRYQIDLNRCEQSPCIDSTYLPGKNVSNLLPFRVFFRWISLDKLRWFASSPTPRHSRPVDRPDGISSPGFAVCVLTLWST